MELVAQLLVVQVKVRVFPGYVLRGFAVMVIDGGCCLSEPFLVLSDFFALSDSMVI